ncbi:MAG: DNA primase [Alcaligenaceae bacterium]|nr:DNA primase [Alcaligenaceae bacterium]
MIPDSFIQDLLTRVDVADVVGRYVQLKKGGINLLGLCPFHNEKSPSFTVSPTKQFYHCFGCGAHGSAITFLIEHTGASFPEAVRSLASAVGMTVPEENRSPGQKAATARRRDEVSQHTRVLDVAQGHYLAQLRETAAAIRYLKQRGLTGEIAKEFGLGWAGSDRQGLAKVFSRYDEAILVESGLVIEAEDGRRYDRFRERVMFPIRNVKGEIVGFGGRIIGKGEPKYLNSPETPVFSKGNELYGLFEARTAIRSEACVIVVEGYMDVVGLAQLGVRNAVATLGTATTPTHIQKLLRASDKVIFSFDGDGAGRRAAWRALQSCLPLLRDDISIRFLFLPSEHDPDSYIRQFGEEAFRACLAESDALSTFFLNELASRHPLKEVEGRSALVHEARPLLALIPTITLKVQLQNEFARLVQLTPEELGVLLEKAPAPMLAGLPAVGQGAGADLVLSAGRSAAEREAVGFAGQGDEARRYLDDEQPESFRSNYPSARSGVRRPAERLDRRAVAPMAKRLLRLLLTHPGLVDLMGEQQLELLERGPHLEMVRELIVLAQASGARHVGALIQASDPGADLGVLMASVAADLMAQESLPNPQAEWEDALRRIELESLKSEQGVLIAEGLNNLQSQQTYRELSARITRLIRVIETSKAR